jgi:hypothetical protein
MIEEVRLPIEGYEGIYEITPSGRIFSVSRNEFRHRIGDEYGFKWVKLSKFGERENLLTWDIWKKTFPTLSENNYRGIK